MSGKVGRPPRSENSFSKPIVLKCRSAIGAAPSEPSLREVGDDHIGPVSCCASKHFAECSF